MVGDDKKGFETLEYPKKSGVKIRPIFNAHDGDFFGASFLVTIPSKLTGGLRERKQFKGLVEAKKWADDIYSGYRKQGHVPPSARRQLPSPLSSRRGSSAD